MSKIEDSICADIQTRSDFGAKKYGVTMERTDLTETQWLQHAYEEALDLAVYLKKILTDREDKRRKMTSSHIHADLMLLYAMDAKVTENPERLWQWRHKPLLSEKHEWRECSFTPDWCWTKDFRRKPICSNLGETI